MPKAAGQAVSKEWATWDDENEEGASRKTSREENAKKNAQVRGRRDFSQDPRRRVIR
jgi:hypothetical protein